MTRPPLRICKRHLKGRRYQTIVVDSSGTEVFAASHSGWTTPARIECEAFIAAQTEGTPK